MLLCKVNYMCDWGFPNKTMLKHTLFTSRYWRDVPFANSYCACEQILSNLYLPEKRQWTWHGTEKKESFFKGGYDFVVKPHKSFANNHKSRFPNLRQIRFSTTQWASLQHFCENPFTHLKMAPIKNNAPSVHSRHILTIHHCSLHKYTT